MKSEKSSQKINFARYSKMLIEFGQSIDHTRGAMQWITVGEDMWMCVCVCVCVNVNALFFCVVKHSLAYSFLPN